MKFLFNLYLLLILVDVLLVPVFYLHSLFFKQLYFLLQIINIPILKINLISEILKQDEIVSLKSSIIWIVAINKLPQTMNLFLADNLMKQTHVVKTTLELVI